MIRQTIAVTLMSLRSLSERLPTVSVVVFGIGGVVVVLVGLLAMSAGFQAALVGSANDDRALILRGSSSNEMDGWVSTDEMAVLRTLEGLEIVSGEVYVTISVEKQEAGTVADVVARGVSAAAFELRPEVELIVGRDFLPGKNEAVVGLRAASRFKGLAIGDRLPVRGSEWTIVGHFTGGGTAVESEIWVDLAVAQSVFRRTFSLARVRLPPERIVAVAEAISQDPRLDLVLMPENVFYSEQSSARTALIEAFAYFIAGIMAIGAVVAALNTMYTVVGQRTKEIATLKALGFRPVSIVVAVITESLLLALVGGALAGVIVYLGFDGYVAATQNAAAGNQLVFAFAVTPEILKFGMGGALLLGLAGGLLPAIGAARQPVAVALRGD